jgi:hypothetical protein
VCARAVPLPAMQGKQLMSSGITDTGGHFLEDDPEAPGEYHCDTCEITVVQTAYALRVQFGTACGNCGTEVIDGPHGGYVCGKCFYVVKPKE